jgi:O-antigen/teichoic acid export membrane protein
MNIQKQTTSNIKWSFVESISLKVVAFVLSIILARLLEPKVFGVLAIVNVFYLLVNIFVDGGLRQALIQKKDTTEIDYSTVFWLNLGLSLLLYGLLFIAAPFIEEFYDFEDLSYFIRLQSVVLIIDSLSIIQIAKATKDLSLKKITTAKIPASMLSFFLGITLAYLEFGVLALIWQQIAYAIIYVSILIINIKYVPSFEFRKKSMLELYSYGLRILGISFVSRFYVQGLNLLFGKFYTPAILGLYTKSSSLQKMPIEILSNSITNGLYPTMVKHQDNNPYLGQLLIRNLKITLALTAIIMTLLFFQAHEVILILLGEQWLPMVPFLKILVFTGLVFPIAGQCQRIFMVKNMLNKYIKIELSSKLFSLLIISILISSFSLEFILIVIVLIFFVISVVYLVMATKVLGIYEKNIIVQIYGILVIHFILGFLCNFLIGLLNLTALFSLFFFSLCFIPTSMALFYRLHKDWIVEILKIFDTKKK